MHWPTRILGLPRAALRCLRSFVRARAGVPEMAPPSSSPPDPTLDPLEFDLRDVPEPDPDTVPTVRERVTGKVEIPGPPKPPSKFPPGRRPPTSRGKP